MLLRLGVVRGGVRQAWGMMLATDLAGRWVDREEREEGKRKEREKRIERKNSGGKEREKRKKI